MALCSGPGATSVDEFIYHNAFASWKALEPYDFQKSPSLPPVLGNIEGWINHLIDVEFRAAEKAAIVKVGVAKLGRSRSRAAVPFTKAEQAAAKKLNDLRRSYIR